MKASRTLMAHRSKIEKDRTCEDGRPRYFMHELLQRDQGRPRGQQPADPRDSRGVIACSFKLRGRADGLGDSFALNFVVALNCGRRTCSTWELSLRLPVRALLQFLALVRRAAHGCAVCSGGVLLRGRCAPSGKIRVGRAGLGPAD